MFIHYYTNFAAIFFTKFKRDFLSLKINRGKSNSKYNKWALEVLRKGKLRLYKLYDERILKV